MRIPLAVLLAAAVVLVGVAQNVAPPPAPPPPPGAALAEDLAPEPEGAGTIRGTVLTNDPPGPLRNAQVTLTGGPLRQARIADTDERGQYEFEQLPPGRYALTAARLGFVELSYGQRRPFETGRAVELEDRELLEGVDFTLPRGGVIVARVTDEYGEPMLGVRFRVERRVFVNGVRKLQPVGRSFAPYLDNRTDDRGEARLYGLPTGEYYVSARGDSKLAGAPIASVDRDRVYVPTYYPGTAAPGAAKPVAVEQGRQAVISFPIVLGKPMRIEGIVRTSAGNVPTRPQTVELVQAGTFSDYAGITATDAGGVFSIRDLAPGDYVLRTAINASMSGSGWPEAAAMPISLTTEDMTGLVLGMSTGSLVRGRFVYDSPRPDGFRATSVTFNLVSPERLVPDPLAQWHDDGTFEVVGLNDGSLVRLKPNTGWYLKAVRLDGRDVTDVPLAIPDGRELDGLQVVVTRTSSAVTGIAVDPNGPASAYTVVLFPEDRAQWTASSRFIATARAYTQGRFGITGMPPGNYLVTAVDYLETGAQFDPEVLDRLKDFATPLALGEGESKDVRLKIVD